MLNRGDSRPISLGCAHEGAEARCIALICHEQGTLFMTHDRLDMHHIVSNTFIHSQELRLCEMNPLQLPTENI